MKKRFLASILPILPIFIILVLLFSAFFFPHFLSPNVKASETRIPKVTTLSEDQVINKDYFAGGEIVTIYGTVNGDVYIGGGQVSVDGKINGDLLVAGGKVNITGKIDGNIRAVGGQIYISEVTVGKNITVLGGDIEIGNTAKIAGSIVSAGGNINILSDVGKGLNAAGGNISVGGKVKNDTQLAGDTIRLGPSANLNGNFDYWSKNDAVISKGALIKGTTLRHDLPMGVSSGDLERFKKEAKSGANAAAGGLKVFGFLSFLIIGLVISKLFPEQGVKVSQFIIKNPWKSLLTGLLVTVVAPIILIIIFLTLIGIPVAFIILSLYLILTYISKYFVMLTVGDVILNKAKQKHSIYLAFTVGLLVYYIILYIPFISELAKLGFLLTGLGGVITIYKNQLSPDKK